MVAFTSFLGIQPAKSRIPISCLNYAILVYDFVFPYDCVRIGSVLMVVMVEIIWWYAHGNGDQLPCLLPPS
jgi:hypothetical protein